MTLVRLDTGIPTGVGSLPHTDAAEAAAFVLDTLPELPAVPQLPRRSAGELMLAQVATFRDGRDDLDADAFGGAIAFFDEAAKRSHRGPIKLQVAGPVTYALATNTPLRAATEAVRGAVRAMVRAAAASLPDSPLVVVVDEPGLVEVGDAGFPFALVDTVDAVSTALAAAGTQVVTGIHCCGPTDWRLLLQAGPDLVSMPVTDDLGPHAGALAAFLDRGGLIAWGAVSTDGPIGDRDDLHWKHLTSAWCDLTRSGCDPILLRTQALVTPACGLALHEPRQVPHVFDLVRGIADRVRDQAIATRLSVGA